MPARKITREGSNACTHGRIKQEMLAECLARIKPVPRDGIAEAW
jgi:hypothetical protein